MYISDEENLLGVVKTEEGGEPLRPADPQTEDSLLGSPRPQRAPAWREKTGNAGVAGQARRLSGVDVKLELLLVKSDVVKEGRLVVLHYEQLAVAGQDHVHLPLHHVDVHPDVDVHELWLDGEECDMAGCDGGVEGTEVRLEGERELVVQAVITVDHHGAVAVVAVSGVSQEILLAPSTLVLPALLSGAAGVGVEVGEGVVVAGAAKPGERVAGLRVSVSVTVTRSAGVAQTAGGAECSRQTLVAPRTRSPVLTVETDLRGGPGV